MNYIGREPAPNPGAQVSLDALTARVAALEAKQTIVAMVAAAGVAVNFAGLPPGIKKLWLHVIGLSTNGASPIHAQLGEAAGGYAVAGYQSNAGGMTNGALAGTQAGYTTGFLLGATAAGYSYHGMLSFVLAGVNTWVAHGVIISDTSAWPLQVGAGSKVLAGPLDRIRLTTSGGVEVFDAGQVGIAYE